MTDATAHNSASPLELGTASLPDIIGDAARYRISAILRRHVSSETSSSTTRGVLAIATAVGAMLWPEISLGAMIVVFGVYAVADAGLAIATALRVDRHRGRLVAQATVDMVVVVKMFAFGDVTRSAALTLLALWVVIMGALRFRDAFEIHDGRRRVNVVLAILALLAVTAGIETIVAPDDHIRVLMINVWIFTILRGVTLIASARRAPAVQR